MQFKRLLFALVLSVSPITQADCLEDGQDVKFMGSVSRESFPGPPNYESIDNGDQPETVWILTIETPNCVVSVSAEDGKVYEVAKSTARFQLVFSDAKEYERHRSLVEHRAVVSGKLFVGVTGHHHTKALVEVREIKSANAK